MDTYRFCDNVWTFMLSDVEFKETSDIAKVEKLKIVACDGKSKHFNEYLLIFFFCTYTILFVLFRCY